MSQVDYTISDQSGASFRSDLNATLAAIVSQNSGATEPATMFAYQFWADTTTGILKQRNAANNAWVSILTMSTGALIGNAATATTSNRVDSGEVTVTAHATTGDIFAAAANSILWDDSGGAITTTIFPNASKAGMVRELRCNGASKFTAGTNLLIEGIPSGTTITLANGALVKVRAISTTQFKMTYSLSGTFTITLTGCSSGGTGTASYKYENGFATLNIPLLTGASTGSNAATLTGFPSCIEPALTGTYYQLILCRIQDNATVAVGIIAFDNALTGDVNVYTTIAAGTWTATSGQTKSLMGNTFVYRVA